MFLASVQPRLPIPTTTTTASPLTHTLYAMKSPRGKRGGHIVVVEVRAGSNLKRTQKTGRNGRALHV